MTCQEARALLAGPAWAEAQSHLDRCPECQIWASCNRFDRSAAVHAGTEAEIVRALTSDLRPARSFPAGHRSFAYLLGGCAVVLAVMIALLGTRGWVANAASMKLYVSAVIAAGLSLGAYGIPRLAVPGEIWRMGRWPVIGLLTVAVLISTLLRPTEHYGDFAQAAVTCIAIGLGTALVSAAVVYALVRQGYVTSRGQTFLWTGNFCGLAGFALLFVFCPHIDLGHHLPAHAGVLLLCMAPGGWLLWRSPV